MADILLELKDLCKYYTGRQSVVIGLSNVDLQFRSGEFVAVTGESGSGKSTLAQVVCGILPYESGELYIEGKPTSHYDGSDWERYRRERISYISQSYGILPGSTVLSNVVSALRITGMDKVQAAERAEELLKMVELWELRGRRAAKLSSGQKQRLSIARALAKPAPILVADEPTGNLDGENSAKVIRLLAQAAKERLVILITHDFQEAEGYATRRIGLKDGRVAQDAELAPKAEAAAREPAVREKRAISAYIAGLQIGGRPVWSVLVGLFFALTAFAVFAFLGTFIVNLDDTSTRVYDDSAFANGDMTRIVVQRMDSQGFTQKDWEAVLSVKNARSLERNSYLADWQYAWQQDVDYQLHYHVESVGSEMDNDKTLSVSVEFLQGKCDFVQTVPWLAGDGQFLTAGRLPETMYEVVIAGPAERIGESIPVYLRDEKTMSVSSYVHIDVTVVGTTDWGSGLYFSDEWSRVVNNYILNGGMEAGAYLMAPVYDTPFITMDESLFDRTFGYSTVMESEGQIYCRTTAWTEETYRNDDGENVTVFQGLTEIPAYLRSDPEKPLEDCLRMELKDVRGSASPRDGINWIGVYTENGGRLPNFVLDREAVAESHPEFEDWQLDDLEEALGNIFYRVRRDENNARVVDLYFYSDEVCALSKALYNKGFRSADMDLNDDGAWMTVLGYHDSTFIGYANVTKDAFDAIASRENPDQVSLFITDYAYTEQVIADLQELGYLAISPYRLGSTVKNETLAAERMQTLLVCLAALAAVVLLQILVLRELFGVQTGSYQVLSDMGLGCAPAQRSLMWQVLLFTLCGQAVGFGAICVCGLLGVRRVVSVMRYLPPVNWLILSGVHLAVSVLAGIWAVKRVRRSVYPKSGEKGDLDLGGEEAAV